MHIRLNLWLIIFLFVINFFGCDFFDLKKVSTNEIKKASEWTKLDQSPSYNECEKFSILEEQKKCFKEKLVSLIYSELSGYNLKSKDEVNSEFIIQIKINETGNYSLDSIIDPNNVVKIIPELKKNIVKVISNLPAAMPAVKTNVGLFVNVKFSLPIKIKSKTPND